MEQIRQATASVAVALDTIGYHYHYFEQTGSFILDFTLKKSRLSEVQAAITVRERYILFHVACMIQIPKEQRERVALYLTYCNCNLVYGNFELNLNDGELRFKNTLPYYDCMPSCKTIEEMLNIPVMMFDRYGNGLLAVIYENADPKEAAAEAENA